MSGLRFKQIVEVFNDLNDFGSTDYLRNRNWRVRGNEEALETKRTAWMRSAIGRYNRLTYTERRYLHRTLIDTNRHLIADVNRECEKRGIDFRLE